jgi:hypothetical protein
LRPQHRGRNIIPLGSHEPAGDESTPFRVERFG